MFNNLIKKIASWIIIWFSIWIWLFMSFAVDNLTQSLNSWDILSQSWFNDLRNKVININSTWAGNVWIWTATPTQKLDVNGNIWWNNWSIWSNGWLSIWYAWASSPIWWAIISWNVWIWTASPLHKLQVNWNLDLENWGQGYSIWNWQAGMYMPLSTTNLMFKTSSIDRMIITSWWNVWIGTSNPSQKLDVVWWSIKAWSWLIIEVRSANPAAPETGRMWLINP